VDLNKVKDSITCDCGQKLEVGAELQAASAGGAAVAASGEGHILASLRNHWRLLTIAGGAVAAAVAVLTLLSTGYLWYVSRERRGYDHA